MVIVAPPLLICKINEVIPIFIISIIAQLVNQQSKKFKQSLRIEYMKAKSGENSDYFDFVNIYNYYVIIIVVTFFADLQLNSYYFFFSYVYC